MNPAVVRLAAVPVSPADLSTVPIPSEGGDPIFGEDVYLAYAPEDGPPRVVVASYCVFSKDSDYDPAEGQARTAMDGVHVWLDATDSVLATTVADRLYALDAFPVLAARWSLAQATGPNVVAFPRGTPVPALDARDATPFARGELRRFLATCIAGAEVGVRLLLEVYLLASAPTDEHVGARARPLDAEGWPATKAIGLGGVVRAMQIDDEAQTMTLRLCGDPVDDEADDRVWVFVVEHVYGVGS